MLQVGSVEDARTLGPAAGRQQPPESARNVKKVLTPNNGEALQRDRFLDRLDANALELFARVVEAGSFAAAGRNLGLTRAAVSGRVATIEAQIGGVLFVRHSRALGLTETGRGLIAHARTVLAATEAARRELRTRSETSPRRFRGSLRVSSCPSYGQGVLAPRLTAFQALHPDLRIELQLSNRTVDLARENFDVAFRMTPQPPQDCIATPVLHFDIRAWAAPGSTPLLSSPAELAHHNCLVWGASTEELGITWRHAENGKQEAVTLNPALCVDDLRTLIDLSVGGAGVVFAPAFAVSAAVQAGALQEVLPGWTADVHLGSAVVALTLAHGVVPDAARVLVEFVRANTTAVSA